LSLRQIAALASKDLVAKSGNQYSAAAVNGMLVRGRAYRTSCAYASYVPRWSAPCCALRLHDLAGRAAPIFLNETSEDDHTYQDRLFWPSDFRDEVLARSEPTSADRPVCMLCNSCRSAPGGLCVPIS